MSVTQAEIAEFEEQADRWFAENKPANPGFILPETFMEVGTDQQFEFLRNWQQKVYENGYVGMSWPKEFGGLGMDQVFQDIATKAMAKHRVPFLPNTIGLNWAGPLILAMGSQEEKSRYIKGILSAEDIWCQGFSEPDHGSDLGNAQTRAVRDGDEYVINGRKWWSSGVGDPRCSIAIVMGKTNPDAPLHQQQSQVLVPLDSPGIEVVRMLPVFGFDDAPHGHAEVVLKDVRVPAENLLLGEGRGFEIAQGRLGPGRIHHCMRTIGVAERALEKMCTRLLTRTAFGKRIADHSVWEQRIAEARTNIEMTRLLTMKAAYMMDTVGNKVAKSEIAQIKVAGPRIALQVIDDAIQAHGGGGVTKDFGLAKMYAGIRTLRLADGPDEVHNRTIARLEMKKYQDLTQAGEGELKTLDVPRS